MGIEELIRKNKREIASDFDNKPAEVAEKDSQLTKSLNILIERDNPMANAAKRALDRL